MQLFVRMICSRCRLLIALRLQVVDHSDTSFIASLGRASACGHASLTGRLQVDDLSDLISLSGSSWAAAMCVIPTIRATSILCIGPGSVHFGGSARCDTETGIGLRMQHLQKPEELQISTADTAQR